MLTAACIGLAATTALSAKVAAPAKRPGVWAQSYAGRPADPAIRFGQLPNGLRYAILRNATPPGQMALRLYIGSGSLAEREDQQGLAHFLEHIAFRGSTHVADGEMMRVLARHGLGLGADTNAATSQEATVYQFDFPHADQDSIDTGLTMFREIAGELTIAPASVDAERGVILSEERLRDSAGYRATKAQLGLLLDGQLAPRRWPIGLVDTIKTAPAALLRDFYEAHYRPDNAAIVAVGDFDPVAMEAQIKRRFADWKPKRPASPPIPLGTVGPRGEQARLSSEPGAPPVTLVGWVRPYDTSADTDARERRDAIRLIARLIVNQRFADLAQAPKPPFLGGGIGRDNILKSADVTTLSVSASPDAQLPALQAAVDEQRRAVQFGVTQAELDRALSRLDAAFETAAAGGASRPSPQVAERIVADIGENEVTTSPAQDLADIRRWIKMGVTPAEIDGALRDMFAGAGPLVFLSTPKPPAGGEAALRASFDAAMKDTLAAGTQRLAGTWPYAGFGAPGTVTATRQIADLGVSVVTFANGVHLTVKPTAFTKDQVLVDVSLGSGRLGLSPSLSRSYWMVDGAVPVFVSGGTGKIGFSDIQRLLAARVVSAELAMNDRAFELSGRTRPQDLATELQLLAAYVADPGFRPEAVERARVALANALPQIAASATGVAQRDVPALLRSGDERWRALPSADALAASKGEDARALLGPALASRPDVTIVGDVTVEQAVAAVAATFGALPPRPAPPVPAATGVAFPGGVVQPVVIHHGGRADQAIALQAWPTNGFYASPADASALVVAANLIKTRLFDQLREIDGATYSPSVGANSSDVIDGYGFVAAQVELPPARMAAFRTRLAAIVADLAARPVSGDELERARRPLVEERLRDRQTNAYWIQALPRAEREDRRLAAIRDRAEQVQRVTADDVRRVVDRYLSKARSYQLEVVKEP